MLDLQFDRQRLNRIALDVGRLPQDVDRAIRGVIHGQLFAAATQVRQNALPTFPLEDRIVVTPTFVRFRTTPFRVDEIASQHRGAAQARRRRYYGVRSHFRRTESGHVRVRRHRRRYQPGPDLPGIGHLYGTWWARPRGRWMAYTRDYPVRTFQGEAQGGGRLLRESPSPRTRAVPALLRYIPEIPVDEVGEDFYEAFRERLIRGFRA